MLSSRGAWVQISSKSPGEGYQVLWVFILRVILIVLGHHV